MRFSIITVSYNSEKTIRKTIESVLNQTFNDFEYIIIDGNSKDNTLNIIKEYEPLFNNKLRYVSERDSGIYYAMNKGIKMANGDYVALLNSDDYYEKDSLEKVNKAIINNQKKDKYEIYYGAVRMIDKNGTELSIDFNNISNIDEKMIFHPSTFVSNVIYKEITLYDTKYKSASDYDLILKLINTGKVKFIPIYEVLSNFRQGGMSSKLIGYEETVKIKRKYGILSKNEYFKELLKITIKKIGQKL